MSNDTNTHIDTLKCANCGAALTYTPGVTSIKCPYCNTVYETHASASQPNTDAPTNNTTPISAQPVAPPKNHNQLAGCLLWVLLLSFLASAVYGFCTAHIVRGIVHLAFSVFFFIIFMRFTKKK